MSGPEERELSRPSSRTSRAISGSHAASFPPKRIALAWRRRSGEIAAGVDAAFSFV
jgi:hypothetical protein